ncbi:MAG: RIP metalloprotease RseP [Gemmatimonadales bacterium]|nr:RIP metalloprotease RseP [Gemmatimonadales bacterium]
MINTLFTVAVLFVVLGVLIFVHELGHYWAAKAFGVWVHRFSIGMGKPVKALSFRRGETEWAISWLPLGGYVKMASREEDPSSSVLEGGSAAEVPPDRVFEAKPVWQRMIIILAGVTLNALFAWAVFTGLAWKNGRQYDPTTTVGAVLPDALPDEARELAGIQPGSRITSVDGQPVESWDDIMRGVTSGDRNEIGLTFDNRDPIVIMLHRDALAERAQIARALQPMHPAVIGSISPNYPARDAGLQVGDSIVMVDGTPIRSWTDATSRIRAAGGREIAVRVVRSGAAVDLKMTPRLERDIASDTTSQMIGRIGASSRPPYLTEPLGFVDALAAGGDAAILSAGAIFQTFRGLLNGQVSTREVGGPILIGQMAAEQARAGIEPLLAFMALISMNLAVVNLLPIPVLDGGAFLILAVEGIIRRPLPRRLREIVSLVGLGLIVLLMVLAFSNDIGRLLK